MPDPLVKRDDGTWARPGLLLGAGPEPPTHYPYFGVTPNVASLGTAGFSSVGDAVTFFDQQAGGMTMYRTFSGGGIGTWTAGPVADVTNNSNATVHHSFKTWDEAAVTAWINGKPDNGLDAFLTFHHEPENDGWNSSQILTWQQRCSRMIELRDATGRTDVKCGPVLMDSWTLNPLSGRDYWRDWYVGPPIEGYTPVGYPTDLHAQDFLGWDPYNWGWDESPEEYVDPATRILDSTHSIMDIHRVTGRPAVVGEYGSPRISTDGDGSGLAAWVADYHQACLDFYSSDGIKVLCVAYWSDIVGAYDSSIHNEPLTLTAMAPFMEASRNHYGIAGV